MEEQEETIEWKRRSLDRQLAEKDKHIVEKEVKKEETMLKKKRDKLRTIFKTLEKSEYLKEKRK